VTRGAGPAGRLRQLAHDLNRLTCFLGMRDLPALTSAGLARVGLTRVDVLVLFGGCAPCGWDAVATAYKRGLADRLLLVGGEGHTTPMLRRLLAGRVPEPTLAAAAEADLMARYFADRHGIDDPLIERQSTNCGNNLTFAQQVLAAAGLAPASMVLVQDPSMQRRMDAGMRRVWTLGHPQVLNFAGHLPTIVARAGRLEFADSSGWGCWDLEHYLTLLLGEIPRLTDDADGYGPAGRGFIAHVDIPRDVADAYVRVRARLDTVARPADPRYAGPQ